MAKVLCKCCNQTAESTYRHDFVQIKNCANETFVDGGSDYTRIGGKILSLIEVL